MSLVSVRSDEIMDEVEDLIRTHDLEVWESNGGDRLRTYFCIICDRLVYGYHMHVTEADLILSLDGTYMIALYDGAGPAVGPMGVPWEVSEGT